MNRADVVRQPQRPRAADRRRRLGIGRQGRQVQEHVGVNGLGLAAGGRLGIGGRLAVRLIAPGRVAVGQAQAIVCAHVLGIDGQRATVACRSFS